MTIANNNCHLLVVDDDERIRNLLQQYLVENGYFVSSVKNCNEAEILLKVIKCNLMILDLMMPGESGLEFTKRLKLQIKDHTPIIMLTAMGEIESRINGLEVGADDYIVKPFEPKELLLRISNILKRQVKNTAIYNFGDYKYNSLLQSLEKNNESIFLTSSEHILLNFFLKNANKVITRDMLAQELAINDRSVDVQIVRLRGKIEANPSRPVFLQTIRGVGYSLKI